MSVTYSIVCDDCKIACWVGQSGYIYDYKYIDNFLKEHMGHNLRYLCDFTSEDVSDYEDYPESMEMCENSINIIEMLINDHSKENIEKAKLFLKKANG